MWKYKPLIISLLLLMAVIFSYYLAQAEWYWLPLTTWFVVQLPAEFLMRQVLQIIFIMVCCVLIIPLLALNQTLYHFSLSVIFIDTAYLFIINKAMSSLTRNMLLLIPLTLIIATLHFDPSLQVAKLRCLDILIGGLLGSLAYKLLSRFKPTKNFKAEVVVVIDCLADCTARIANSFVEQSVSPPVINKNLMQPLMLHQCKNYPEWIYSPGFNPALRAGFRFYLIHIERIADILYALDNLVSIALDNHVWRGKHMLIATSLRHNQELLQVLGNYFNSDAPISIATNYTQDIAELEAEVQQVLPKDPVLYDLDQTNLVLASLVREIKDMRSILLQLVLITQKATQTR